MDRNLVSTLPSRTAFVLGRLARLLRDRVARSPREGLAAVALGVLLVAGGLLIGVEASAPPAPPAPPGALAEGLAGPPTRAAAEHQAQHRRATTIEEYEMVRAARF